MVTEHYSALVQVTLEPIISS